MLHNYVLIAWRNLLRNRNYSIINIAGLAIGIACCLLILLYVADELSYDRFWKNSDRIQRMALVRKYPEREAHWAIIPPSYAFTVKRECPEVEEATRIFNPLGGNGTLTLRYNEKVLEEKEALMADSTFFKVFTLQMLQGDPATALNEPNSVVLTESTARRYFGTEPALGKLLTPPAQAGEQPFKVTGVCADVPANAHFSFNLLQTTSGVKFVWETNHISFAASTYFLLKPGALPAALEQHFPAIVDKYAGGEVQRQFGTSYEEYRKAGNGYRYFLQALPGIHLHSDLEGELKPTGSCSMVRIFMVIAAFILLIACINFMNLSTARSAERAREVGIRKTLGSVRRQLAGQFLLEAILVTGVAALFSLLLVQLALPGFNRLAEKSLSMGRYVQPLTVALTAAYRWLMSEDSEGLW